MAAHTSRKFSCRPPVKGPHGQSEHGTDAAQFRGDREFDKGLPSGIDSRAEFACLCTEILVQGEAQGGSAGCRGDGVQLEG